MARHKVGRKKHGKLKIHPSHEKHMKRGGRKRHGRRK